MASHRQLFWLFFRGLANPFLATPVYLLGYN